MLTCVQVLRNKLYTKLALNRIRFFSSHGAMFAKLVKPKIQKIVFGKTKRSELDKTAADEHRSSSYGCSLTATASSISGLGRRIGPARALSLRASSIRTSFVWILSV